MVDKVVDAFDELAVSLSSGGSRRLIVRRLALSALGVLGMMNLAEDDAEAAGKNGKKKKRGGKKRRPKKCPPGHKRCGKRCCGKGKVCKQGKCQKPGKPQCTPKTKVEACGIWECGTAPDGCGGNYQCGDNDGECPGAQDACIDGDCVCQPLTRAQACGDRVCGEAPDGCGGTYQCGENDGNCPTIACQTAIACTEDGECIYETESLQGSICGVGGSGMCVDGTCELTNPNGICRQPGASGCVSPQDQGFVGYCNIAESCLCYTTVEGAGFCIDYPDGIGCQNTKPDRVPCSSSTECGPDHICINLNTPDPSNPGSYTGVNCCNGTTEVLGMCVPLSIRCSNPD